MKIRKMELTDIPIAFSIRASTRENALTKEELQEYYDLNPTTLAVAMNTTAKGWVGESNGAVVGFAMGDSEYGELTVLAVLPEYEGKGLGKMLLCEVQHWLFSQGHQQLWLVTTPDPKLRAYGFYQAQGWIPTGEIIDEEEKFVLKATQ